jgi:Uma2 family endonuclease
MLSGIYRMTARQFRKAIDAGVFGEQRVELLGGIPFVMSENPPHIYVSIQLIGALNALAAAPQWVVNKDHRIGLGQWLPLPDAVILRGPARTYSKRWARAGDVAFLAEIADSSYARDKGIKLRRYAGFRIPVYWIIDVNRRLVEVHTQPHGTGTKAGYAQCDTYVEGDQIPVLLDGQDAGQIGVDYLLP